MAQIFNKGANLLILVALVLVSISIARDFSMGIYPLTEGLMVCGGLSFIWALGLLRFSKELNK